MKRSLIAEVLEPFGVASQRGEEVDIHEVLLYEPGAEDVRGRAYVLDDPGARGQYLRALIISIGETGLEAENRLVLSRGPAGRALNALIRVLGRLERLNEALYAAQDSQSVIDIASEKTRLPFFYFDDSYRILAITQRTYFVMDEEWAHMTGKGYLSPRTARLMNESGDLDYLAGGDEPILYDSPLFPFVCVACNVRYREIFRGRVNLLLIDRDAIEEHIAICRIVRSHLLRLLREGRVPDDKTRLRNVLTDVLDGVRLPDDSTEKVLRDNGFGPDGSFQLYAMDIRAGEDQQLYRYFMRLLERLLTGYRVCAFPYSGHLMLFARVRDRREGQGLREKLGAFTAGQNLACGASQDFTAFERLRGCYEQALFARGRASAGQMIEYERVLLDRLFSFVPEEQLAFLMSDAYLALQSADRDSSFPMSETVWCYLKSGCNLARTAQALSIHKNTLLYRLNKVRSSLGLDLDDFDTRIALESSFLLREKRR